MSRSSMRGEDFPAERVSNFRPRLSLCSTATTDSSRIGAKRFLRWAYWITHSGSVAGLSTSASYMATIQAVETLRPRGRAGHACPVCGLQTGPGETRQFIDFMDEYVPRQDGETEAERRTLYSLRSGLTHGGTLMQQDLERGFAQFTPTWIEERRTTNRASALARLAGVNWLLADGK